MFCASVHFSYHRHHHTGKQCGHIDQSKQLSQDSGRRNVVGKSEQKYNKYQV